ncbi:MAG: hypothetical protein KBC34_01055 [Phenylobacterium sp.]|nr:hypothetical protein [Phenylobacterium sp.]
MALPALQGREARPVPSPARKTQISALYAHHLEARPIHAPRPGTPRRLIAELGRLAFVVCAFGAPIAVMLSALS